MSTRSGQARCFIKLISLLATGSEGTEDDAMVLLVRFEDQTSGRGQSLFFESLTLSFEDSLWLKGGVDT